MDLLACSLLKSREGREVFETIERETQCDFAASDNVTGNPRDGGDWIMESDNVDIRDFYFYNTDEFSGTFAAHSTRDAGIDEAEVVRRVAAARTEALDAASQEYEAKIRALEVEKQEAATEVSAELEAATAAAAASTRAHAETERQLAELKNTAEAVAVDRDAEEKRKLDAYHSELEEIQRAAEVERNGLQERLALEHSETIQRHIVREQELQEKL